MPWNRETISQIYDRMKADFDARVEAANPDIKQSSILTTSLVGIILVVFAGAIHLVYGYLAYIARQLLIATMDWEHLVAKAAEKGITPLPATKAVDTVVFTGTDTTIVPAGTLIQLATGVRYLTDTAVEISGGSATVSITAETAGVSGNSSLTTFLLVNPIPGISSEVNSIESSNGPSGGSNTESLEAFRARYLDYVRQPPAGGRAYDYERWAKEVAGVGQAWAFDVYNGPGTVGVIIGNDNEPVSEAIKATCAAYIETKKVLGSTIYVVDIVPTVYDFAIELPAGDYDKSASVTAQMEQLFLDESMPGATIKLSHIQAAILATLVDDYEISAILKDGTPIAIDDIAATGAELPVLGEIIYGLL